MQARCAFLVLGDKRSCPDDMKRKDRKHQRWVGWLSFTFLGNDQPTNPTFWWLVGLVVVNNGLLSCFSFCVRGVGFFHSDFFLGTDIRGVFEKL